MSEKYKCEIVGEAILWGGPLLIEYKCVVNDQRIYAKKKISRRKVTTNRRPNEWSFSVLLFFDLFLNINDFSSLICN